MANPQSTRTELEVGFDLKACHRAFCDCSFKLEAVDEDALLTRAEAEERSRSKVTRPRSSRPRGTAGLG